MSPKKPTKRTGRPNPPSPRIDAEAARELLDRCTEPDDEDTEEVETPIDGIARPDRADEPHTEAYRTYRLMLSHIWQSRRTDETGRKHAAQNAAWAKADQRKLDELAAQGRGLTDAEKHLADQLDAEHKKRLNEQHP